MGGELPRQAAIDPRDLEWLRHAILLAARARAEGQHPFGALLVDAGGRLIAEATNASRHDRTAHAEMEVLRRSRSTPERLRGATLFSSAEPCAMCAGGAYWAGVVRVIYALSEKRLLALTGSDPENPTLSLPCREVFARGQRVVEVAGPFLEDEAAAPHCGFWGRA